MRTIPIKNTTVYRWLVSQVGGGQFAYGPYSKRIKYTGVTWGVDYVELQQLSFGYDENGHEELQWVAINKLTKEELNG